MQDESPLYIITVNHNNDHTGKNITYIDVIEYTFLREYVLCGFSYTILSAVDNSDGYPGRAEPAYVLYSFYEHAPLRNVKKILRSLRE